jgi:hypothetical protein
MTRWKIKEDDLNNSKDDDRCIRAPSWLNLGPQRHQRLFIRLILIRNTLRDESEDIIAALQSQSLKLYSLLLSQ